MPRYSAFFRPASLLPVILSKASNMAPAIGTIIIVQAVLVNTMDRDAVTAMNAASIMMGRVPTNVRERRAMRRCRLLFSTASATMKEPMNTHIVSLK